MTRFAPVAPSFPHLLHGGDYNPEQWLATPEVWDEDVRLMKLAGCNTATIGVFSWAALEPTEGRFEFGWLDRVMDKMSAAGIRVILATPGGARPAWLAQKYPQVLRVDAERRRQLWGMRHNHCYTSLAFRQKAQAINTQLAQRYGRHPMLTMWHVNNEYNGECHCDLCQAAFRQWLRGKYDNSLEKLNHAWWNAFWSHQVTDWEQIQSPSPIGEQQVHGMNLDWKRFVTHQTVDCFRAEAEPLRRLTPNVPITTNMIGGYAGLDYYQLGAACDVVSWDSYPAYHDRETNWEGAVFVSFLHSQRRAMLQRPFILMESAPGQQNYKPVCKQKRPGVHKLEAMQAIAHGSDSILYFQWRKSRGSVEKFHGAVVDHHATEHHRVFREVAELGQVLAKLDNVVGTDTKSEVAVIYDYQCRWAYDDAKGPRNKDKDVAGICAEHYRAFWQAGVNCDVISQTADFSRYKLIVAPLMYMVRPGNAERLEAFVSAGGTFVTTYLSGIVDENDLCHLGGFPGPLRKLCGVLVDETDALYDDEHVDVVATGSNGLSGMYRGGYLCDVIAAETAEVLATYGSQFYAGSPAVTLNRFGQGRAYYIASRNDVRFHQDFYAQLIDDCGIGRATGEGVLPRGVTAQVRSDGTNDFVFVMNFTRDRHQIRLGDAPCIDTLSGEPAGGVIDLPGYTARVLTRVGSR